MEDYKAVTSRKRKRSTRSNEPKYEMTPLFLRQAIIGCDNLLMGKFDREWRIQQREYEALENRKDKDRNIKRKLDGMMIYPYVHNEKEKHQNRKKKKKQKQKSKDVFQHLIERIFVIMEETLWKQRNLDRHQSNKKTRYTEVIKTDREIRKFYGLSNHVRPTDKDNFYSTDFKQ